MSLILFLLTSMMVYGFADDLMAQRVTLSKKNATLAEVIGELRQQSGYDFLIKKELAKKAKPISIQAHNEALAVVLKRILDDQNLTYAIMDDIKSVVIKEKTSTSSDATSASELVLAYTEVKGRVVDSVGNALVGASVRVLNAEGKRTSLQTTTDPSGYFILRNVPEEGSLEISYVGYNTKTIQVKADMGNILLQALPSGIDDVVIIGYGQTSKRLNTGSVASVSAKEIEQQPVTNVLSALSGRMSGVFVQTTNGLPGGNIDIQIRGKGSMVAGTDPLYIIDGIPFESSDLYSSGHRVHHSSVLGVASPLNSVNPGDIESITVLKDADATAIYGSRGTNGVVIITTKKGKENDGSTIRLDVYQGINRSANLPKMMNVGQIMQIRREAFKNDGLIPSDDPASSVYAPDLLLWDTTQVTDWVDYLYGGTAHVTDIQVGISDGNARTSFNVNGNYRTESNILPGDSRFQRGGIHGSLVHMALDGRLSLSFKSSLILDDNKTSNPSYPETILRTLPHYPIYDESGELNWAGGANPIAAMLASSQGKNRNVLANVGIQYKLLPSLQLKLNAGYNGLNTNRMNIFPSASLYPGTLNYTEVGHTTTQSFIVEPQVNYQRMMGSGNLSAMLGGTYQYRFSDGLFVMAEDFATEALMANIGSAKVLKAPSSLESQYKYASIFGRLVYDYKGRYVISLTGRRDGSSKFGPGNQFGNFGSIGAAWIFSDESWMNGSKSILSFGKLRTSFGVTGNDKITNYQFLSTYKTSGTLVYSGVSPLQPSRLANANFHWESTQKFESALELGFINDQFFLIVNYYRNQSSDQLVNYTLPSITGFSSYQANLPATVRNTGWEIELQAKNIRKKDWSWTTNFNITFPKNKLVSFENFEKSSYANTYELGYDITRVSGYKFLGVDPKTGNAMFADKEGNRSDDLYNNATHGKRTPDFYGGLGNSLQFKKWDVNIFLQFVKQMNEGGMSTYMPGVAANMPAFMWDRWQKEGDITLIPKASTKSIPYYGWSDANFFKADYLRVKSLNLGYRLPLQSSGSKSIRIYAEGQNLFTFWKERNAMLDPESGGSNMPPVRSLVVGLSLTL